MAVDLSRVGLEGIETGQRTLNSIAARKSQEVADSIAMAEEGRKRDELALDQMATQQAGKIMLGEGVDITSPEASEEDMARFMAITGSKLMSAGAPKRGKEMVEGALDLIKKRADINKSHDDAQQTRLENIEKAGKFMYEMLADSENESEYKFNLANLPEEVINILGPENVEQLRQAPWSPEMQAFLKDKALSTYQQATLALQAQNAKRLDQLAADAAFASREANAVAWARHRESVRANAVREKAGGDKIAVAPTTDELKAAKAAILQNVEGLEFSSDMKEDPVQLQAAMADIVGSAKQMLKQNQGLSFADAVNRAVLEADAAGDFVTIRNYRDFGLFQTEGTKSTTYKRQGRSKENAIPLPTGTPDEVRGQLKTGRYYKTKAGVLKWNGSEFEE